MLEQEKEHNNANFTPSLLEEEEESVTAERAGMVYELQSLLSLMMKRN